MASTIKVTNINTPDGTGNIIVDRPLSGSGASLTALPAASLTGTIADARFPATLPVASGTNLTALPAANLTGALPAISGASLTNLPAGGDTRNFIIDGDFTQWPTGAGATTSVHGGYTGHALTQFRGTSDGSSTWERSTDVPTVAQSSHQSKYSFLLKCTGTDSSIGSNQGVRLYHYITGSDYTHLHAQQVTISFWAKTASANSGDTYYMFLMNAAGNRSYVKSFAPTSSWVKYTFTQTMDTTGTWLFTEADIGVQVGIALASGTDNDDATDGVWGATTSFWASGTPISNFLDNTSNEFYISQWQVVLGSSAPTFLGEPVATVARQVEYYVERYSLDSASNEHFVNINGTQTSTADSEYRWAVRKRAAPTVTFTAGATFAATTVSAGATCTAITASTIVPTGFRLRVTQAGTTWTVGGGGNVRRDGSDTANVLFDARH